MKSQDSKFTQISRECHSGFTLIELLVVISLIAVLMAILMPALRKARELGRRAACMGHMRQMQLAWYTYASDNDGYLVNAQPWFSPEDVLKPNNSIPWLVSNATGECLYPQTAAEAKAMMESGALAPYIGNINTTLCPARYRHEGSLPQFKGAQWLSSYYIVASMNAFHPKDWDEFTKEAPALSRTRHGPFQIRKLSQLSHSAPVKRLVFADSGYGCGIGWACSLWVKALLDSIGSSSSGSELLDYGRRYVYPPIHHSNGTCMSFADGHVEYWKWKSPDTLSYGEHFRDLWIGKIHKLPDAPLWYYLDNQNPDGKRVVEAIWGVKATK